jgi:NADH-quinone oxidoreductase subunit H
VLALIGLFLLAIVIGAKVSNHDILNRATEGLSNVFWFVFKVAVFMYLYIWYRATWPRYRFDQLMKVGWKVMLPISLGVLIVTAIVGVLLG